MRRLLALLLTALLLLAPACVREEPAPMRIGTTLWVGNEPLFLARELGRLDARQVRLVEYSSYTEMARAFRNGAVEGVITTLDMALVLEQHGFQPRVVLVLDTSMGGDALIARPEVRDLADLKGHRVAMESSGVSEFLLGRALEHGGLEPTDLEILHLPMDQHARALSEGVDAVVTMEPMASQLLAAGARKLFDSSQIPGEVVDVLLVREEALAPNEARVRRLCEVWFEALAYLEANPEEAIALMRGRHGVSQAEFTQALRGLRFPPREENRALLEGPSPGLVPVAERVQRLLLEVGMLRHPVALEALPAPLGREERPR